MIKINAARSNSVVSPKAWVTFCRGDAVNVLDETRRPVEATTIVDIENACVLTACGRRWLQGTGEQVACLRDGRPELLKGLVIHLDSSASARSQSQERF